MSDKPLDEQLMAHSENIYKLACAAGKLEAERNLLQAEVEELKNPLKNDCVISSYTHKSENLFQSIFLFKNGGELRIQSNKELNSGGMFGRMASAVITELLVERDRDALKDKLNEAVDRIKDILNQDDAQAYKEAEKFLDKLEAQE